MDNVAIGEKIYKTAAEMLADCDPTAPMTDDDVQQSHALDVWLNEILPGDCVL